MEDCQWLKNRVKYSNIENGINKQSEKNALTANTIAKKN